MAASAPGTSHLDSYQTVVSAYCGFLTVAVHTLLYERDIYPCSSFVAARKYNFPVQQNRHPAVCRWIDDAIAAIEVELLKSSIAQISLIIFSPSSKPLERYVFSTATFPMVPAADIRTALGDPIPADGEASPVLQPLGNAAVEIAAPLGEDVVIERTPMINLTTQFAAVLSRVSTSCASLGPLPSNSTFSLAIETKDPAEGGAPPIGWPMPWTPAPPGLQKESSQSRAAPKPTSLENGSAVDQGEVAKAVAPASSSRTSEQQSDAESSPYALPPVRERGRYRKDVRSTPIRTVEAGPFVMEVWVEETAAKLQSSSALSSSPVTTKSAMPGHKAKAAPGALESEDARNSNQQPSEALVAPSERGHEPKNAKGSAEKQGGDEEDQERQSGGQVSGQDRHEVAEGREDSHAHPSISRHATVEEVPDGQ